jgi:hypothetical protein
MTVDDPRRLPPPQRKKCLMSPKAMLGFAIVLFVAVVVYGLSCVKDFGGNLLAEVAGVAAGVVVAVLVVETILERRRNQAWALVRGQLASSGRTLAQMAARDLHLALPQPDRAANSVANPSPMVMPAGHQAATLDRLAGALDAHAETYDPNTADTDPVRLHDALSPVIWRIRSELGPRVLASGEPPLVHAFGQIDETLGAWDIARYEAEAEPNLLPSLWRSAADFARALAAFVRVSEGQASS